MFNIKLVENLATGKRRSGGDKNWRVDSAPHEHEKPEYCTL